MGKRPKNSEIRAISIRQPYVELILRGLKRYEYRSRPTRIRGRVYIYASLRPGDEDGFRKLGKAPGELPTGRIVGTVEVVGCRFFSSRGCYGYELKNPKRLKKTLAPKKQPQPCWFFPF